MLRFLPAPLQGLILFIALAFNTIFWSSLLYVVALGKLIIPIHGWRILCGRLANAIAQNWVGINALGLKLSKHIGWDIRGLNGLQPDAWYLLLANHQSMVDIVVLQSIFHGKIPPLKFFLKKELIWVPFLGIAWWALDFPFMKRKSSTHKDLEAARKACDKFRLLPATIMNFAEGTRFSTAKREAESSPFTHLLRPRPGGTAVALYALGQQLRSILDVTIVYPKGTPGLWAFLCTSSIEIKVRVKQIPITQELLETVTDPALRAHFKDWMNTLWSEKDKLIEALLHQPAGKLDGV
ncbi:MAG: acyltransferase [Syntrophobacteraceae bacterium]